MPSFGCAAEFPSIVRVVYIVSATKKYPQKNCSTVKLHHPNGRHGKGPLPCIYEFKSRDLCRESQDRAEVEGPMK